MVYLKEMNFEDVKVEWEFFQSCPAENGVDNEFMTKADAEKLLQNKEQRIFVYCRSGRRSKEASQKLVDYGYTNVIEIGGILDYSGVIEK